ncbi:MAG: hypothetical protein EHM93_01730 [Bacteroidales bacterium]|nr:MAG: hypothetical protein EHM93_01730 [Bacteroidales bacterium]
MMEKWNWSEAELGEANIACLHRFRIASAEQSWQTGKEKIRRNPIIDFIVRQLPDRSSSTIPCLPCLPAGRRQAGIIPISNEKFVTNYNLEYYHYFLNRTHVILSF